MTQSDLTGKMPDTITKTDEILSDLQKLTVESQNIRDEYNALLNKLDQCDHQEKKPDGPSKSPSTIIEKFGYFINKLIVINNDHEKM